MEYIVRFNLQQLASLLSSEGICSERKKNKHWLCNKEEDSQHHSPGYPAKGLPRFQ